MKLYQWEKIIIIVFLSALKNQDIGYEIIHNVLVIISIYPMCINEFYMNLLKTICFKYISRVDGKSYFPMNNPDIVCPIEFILVINFFLPYRSLI